MVRVLSYGGGLDSFAMLLLAIQRGAPPDLVIFADVTDPNGADPGEWPGTYQHIRDVVIPLCDAHAIEFHWRDATAVSLVRALVRARKVLHSAAHDFADDAAASRALALRESMHRRHRSAWARHRAPEHGRARSRGALP